VRRALGQPTNPDGFMALAIRGYAPSTGPAVQQIITAPATQWPAYAWNFPIGDGRANIGYGEVLRGTPLTRERLLERMAALLPDVDTAAATALRAHHLPLSTFRPVPGRGRLLLAGDAHSLINPFTGEGIFYAVLSGAIAGTVAARAGRGAAQLYGKALALQLGRHLRHSRFAAFLTSSARVVDATIRAAGAEQRTFDAIVRLGLGDGLLSPRTLAAIVRNIR